MKTVTILGIHSKDLDRLYKAQPFIKNKIKNTLDIKGNYYSYKLQASDVDMIRFLYLKDFKDVGCFAKYFKVPRSTVSSVIKRKSYYKHYSPFEEKFGKYGVNVNKYLFDDFSKVNSQVIDNFMKFYLQYQLNKKHN